MPSTSWTTTTMSVCDVSSREHPCIKNDSMADKRCSHSRRAAHALRQARLVPSCRVPDPVSIIGEIASQKLYGVLAN